MKYQVRQRANGVYFVDFQHDETRYRVSLNTSDEKQANKIAFDRVVAVINEPQLKQNVAANKDKKLTIEKMLNDYLSFAENDPAYKRKSGYIALIRNAISKLITGTAHKNSFRFGTERGVMTLTQADLTELKISRSKISKFKMGTISHELRILRAALNHARFQGFAVPHVQIKVPQNVTRQRHFNDAQFKKIYEHLNPDCHDIKPGTLQYRAWKGARDLALFLRLTGTRVSEAGSVRFCDVDFQGKCIKVATAKQKKPVWRHVPVPDVLADAIKERMEFARAYDPEGFMDRFIFETLQKRIITRAINKLGFNEGQEEHLCIHSLRHSFASETLKTGQVSLLDMTKLLGHSSVKTTEIYAHFVPAETIQKALSVPSPV